MDTPPIPADLPLSEQRAAKATDLLFSAIAQGPLALTRKRLSQGADPRAWRDIAFHPLHPNRRNSLDIKTPLMLAAARDLLGMDALMLAIEHCFVDTRGKPAALLIPHADLSLRDCLGKSALDKARDRELSDIADAIETRLLAQKSAPESSLPRAKAPTP